MLSLLLIIPILGSVLLIPVSEENENSHYKMKKIALFISLLNLLISVYMWFQFDYNSTSYQFVYEFNTLNFCHFHVGVDGISLFFVLLTWFDMIIKLLKYLSCIV